MNKQPEQNLSLSGHKRRDRIERMRSFPPNVPRSLSPSKRHKVSQGRKKKATKSKKRKTNLLSPPVPRFSQVYSSPPQLVKGWKYSVGRSKTQCVKGLLYIGARAKGRKTKDVLVLPNLRHISPCLFSRITFLSARTDQPGKQICLLPVSSFSLVSHHISE